MQRPKSTWEGLSRSSGSKAATQLHPAGVATSRDGAVPQSALETLVEKQGGTSASIARGREEGEDRVALRKQLGGAREQCGQLGTPSAENGRHVRTEAYGHHSLPGPAVFPLESALIHSNPQ